VDSPNEFRKRAQSLIETMEPRAGVLTVSWMALIFALSSRQSLPRTGINAQILAVAGHFVMFGVLGFLLALLLQRRGWPWHLVLVSAVALSSLYGVTDEFHQSLVPGRYPDIADVAVDTLGAASAVLLLHWLQSPRNSRSTA
jgi:glycopeptide antibiotics resistance protein